MADTHDPASAPAAPEVVAVVDIGASAIRMAIAEVGPRGDIRTLETPAKPVPIGRDVFTTQRISRPTRLEVIDVLKGFAELMETYQVRHRRIIATSALREALDRDTFLDWVYVRTGIDIEVIEPIEETQLTLTAVQSVLGPRLKEARDVLIMEVGGGSTELMILHRGDVVLSQGLSLGALRMQQKLAGLDPRPATRMRLLSREIEGVVQNVAREFDLGKIDFFVSLGSEMRFVARTLGERAGENCLTLRRDAFASLVRDVSRMDVDGIVDRFGLPFADAETLSATLSVHLMMLEATGAEQVTVPMVSLRDGLLLGLASLVAGRRGSDFSRQVIASARALGRKYHYDQKHALQVGRLALKLFDFLQKDHKLGQRERLLLEVSCILHDIGMFVRNSAHHKHSQYLVKASELFGLRKAEKDVLSEIVRYHRKAIPMPTHLDYMSLSRADRVTVSKLAAILRVADALDRAHLGRVRDFDMERQRDALVLRVRGVDDLAVERSGLKAKGDLFEDVFGLTVVLEEASATS
ncbi:MAG: Exopolyphosphatase [Phycisphaerae bacterium]|nr:Exopolyphosphatase [Phycisphaerae bacterium]